jgi:hypothetical protein
MTARRLLLYCDPELDGAFRRRLERALDELQIAFADGGRSATCRRACTASFRTEFTGTSTLEQMHRLQGQGLHSHEESRVLVAEYLKGKNGWAIERVRLA